MTGTISILAELWIACAVHLWQSTLVILPVLLLGRLLRPAPGRLLNTLWWAALVKLLVPLSVFAGLGDHFRGLVGSAFFAGRGIDATAGAWIGGAARVLDPIGVHAQPVAERLAGAGVFVLAATVLWVIGALWILRTVWRRRPGRRDGDSIDLAVAAPSMRRQIEVALRGTCIEPGRIELTGASTMPAVVGLLRPRIRLPGHLVRSLPTVELRAILLHEAEHCRRLDPLRELASTAAVLAFFYYPLLWPLLRRLHGSTEIACDEAAVRAGVDPATCASALARTLSLNLRPVSAPAAIHPRRSSLLRQRFDRLRHSERYVAMPMHRLAIAAIIILVACVSLFPLVPRGGDVASAADSDPSTAKSGESVAGETMPKILPEFFERPEYPERARKEGVEGRVVVEVLVLQDGTVDREIVAIEEIDGFPEFTLNTFEAVRRWRFEPGTVAGEPVDMQIAIPVKFRLDNCDDKQDSKPGSERDS